MSDELDFLSRAVASGRLNRRDFLGRAAALGVGATLANSLIGRTAQAAEPVRGGKLVAGLVGGQSTDGLDPAQIDNQVKGAFARCWGEKLLEIKRDGTLRPWLATDYHASDDAKTWTFKIRKDVTFHDGKTLTAEDVRATIERHAGPETKSGALGVLRGIERLEAHGDEFVVTLKEANADLPFLMTDFHLVIQPGGGKDDPSAGVGTGPYRMATHEPGVREVGARYEGYWNPDERGFADQVEILVINDSAARMAALQSGRTQMMNRVEPKIIDLLKRVPGISIRNITGKAHYVFAAQCTTPPFDDNNMRLALKYAIDRKQMLDTVLRGYGKIGNDIPVNDSYAFFPEGIEQREFDPDKAAFHYKKSGHDGPIVFKTSDVAFPGAVEAAQLFQQSAAKAGIKIDVQRVPGDGYWSEVWNKAPFSASYWVGRPTQDQQYSTAYISSADWNETRFKREDFDRLVAKARATLEDDKRKALYRDIAMMVRDEGGAIIPVFNDWVDGVSDKVGGYDPHPAGELMSDLALVSCWLKE